MPPKKRGLNLANTKRSTYKRQKKHHPNKIEWDTPLSVDNNDSNTDTADEDLPMLPKPQIEVQEEYPLEQPSHKEVLTVEDQFVHMSHVETQTSQYEPTSVLTPPAVLVDKESQTDSSVLCNDAEMNQWLEEAGEQNLFENLKAAMTNGSLKQNNICLKLFCEFVRNLSSTRIVYTPETLLWWVTGLKMYGSGWLRLMKGTPEKPNFSVPSQTTLRSLCPRAIRLKGPRRPGMFTCFVNYNKVTKNTMNGSCKMI